MSENIYEEAWQKYYRENGLEWLASSHIYDIKQAFFAGIGAVEQGVEPTPILCDEGCGKVAEFHRCWDHIT